MSGDGRLMLVNAVEREETRIAVVDGGRLEDYHVERTSQGTLVGNIYKGIVESVHPGLQAAFVDLGLDRNAFLHVSETFGPGEAPYHRPRPGVRRRRAPRQIQKLLRPGQEVLVQVIRDPFGEKGPSVSMEVSLPGRFLVLMPLSSRVGVSKKIASSAQRSRLKAMIEQLLRESKASVGFIVRTASADTPPEDLKADFDYLLRLWGAVEARQRSSPAPVALYHETDLVIRTVRDFFAPEISRIVVDERGVFQRLCEFFEGVMPRFRDRLEFYEGTAPLFHRHGVEAQIEQLHSRTVALPSGGTVVIEPTEGLTAVDVNSGRLVGEDDPEELALRTNLEAAREIFRQIRLRDLGGIIVVDFIDLKREEHRRQLERTAREESRKDRAQMVILPLSEFGLLQIARQKIRPSVQFVSHEPCPACGGTGFVKNLKSMVLEVFRTLKSMLEREDLSVVEARVSPEVASALQERLAEIRALEQAHHKSLRLTPTRELPSHRVELAGYTSSGEKVIDLVR